MLCQFAYKTKSGMFILMQELFDSKQECVTFLNSKGIKFTKLQLVNKVSLK